jgi:hypothetical protein
MIRVPRELAMLGRVGMIAALIVSSCSNGQSPPHYVLPESGVNSDGFRWPDHALVHDQYVFPTPDIGSGNPDTGQALEAGAGDQSTTCPGPQGANCLSPCASDEICTEAKGGTCSRQITLTGQPTSKPLLVKVVEAFVACWNKFSVGKNVMCSTFDTCGMSAPLSKAMIDDFVCNQAQASDFSSPSVYEGQEGARSIWACDCCLHIYRFDWVGGLTAINAPQKGKTCITFHKWSPLGLDKVDVVACKTAAL